MNDTRDITMTIEKAQQVAQRYIMAPALYSTILIVQFVARMHKANLLKKTDWDNFDKFMKFCDYDAEVADIPLSDHDIEAMQPPAEEGAVQPDGPGGLTEAAKRTAAKELVKEGIREKLDAMGIHYCMLENDFDEGHIKLYYKKGDRQRMQDFLSSYIKDHLVSGEMDAGELKRMMGEGTSIISVPDALEEKIQDAMAAVGISFARIEDLNLADGKKQMYIPNHQLQAVGQLYGEIRNGLIAVGGADPGPMGEMTQEELSATAICSTDADFVSRCDEKHRDTSDSFVNEGSKTWEEVADRYEPLGSRRSAEYINNELYEEISIDSGTLVPPVTEQVLEKNGLGDVSFACRIPRCYGENTKYLVIPKDRVFRDTHADRERYVAFLKKDENQMILDADGREEKGSPMADTGTLMAHFDKRQPVPANGKDAVLENYVPTAGTDPAPSPADPASAIGYRQPDGKKNSFNNFTQREYHYDSLEQKLLEGQEAERSTPDIPGAADIPEVSDAIDAPKLSI